MTPQIFQPFLLDDISIPNLSDHFIFFLLSSLPFYFLILLLLDNVPNIQCII